MTLEVLKYHRNRSRVFEVQSVEKGNFIIPSHSRLSSSILPPIEYINNIIYDRCKSDGKWPSYREKTDSKPLSGAHVLAVPRSVVGRVPTTDLPLSSTPFLSTGMAYTTPFTLSVYIVRHFYKEVRGRLCAAALDVLPARADPPHSLAPSTGGGADYCAAHRLPGVLLHAGSVPHLGSPGDAL